MSQTPRLPAVATDETKLAFGPDRLCGKMLHLEPTVASRLDEVRRSEVPAAHDVPRARRDTQNGIDVESLTREEELKLVQRLFLMAGSNRRRVVVFAGVEHGNGGGWICARAAETLAAQETGSVCVVDANFRSASLHRYFGVDNRKDLATAISESGSIAPFAQRLSSGNLWLVPSGAVASDSHLRLAADRLRSCLGELRARFDYVLINAPPVDLYADAISLGQLVDGVVLVVEAHSTRRQTLRTAKDHLDAANVPLLGVVLNNRTFPIPEALYRTL